MAEQLTAERDIGAGVKAAEGMVVVVLLAVSFSHMLNDMMQSLIPATYPLMAARFGLSYSQVGLITLVFQITGALLQPFIGRYTDRKPQPFSLAIGMSFTLVGLIVLAIAQAFPVLLAGAGLVGIGSSVFHPESSRVARLASGGRHGLAQSVFQVGGNAGAALGPLLAAFIVLPRGQGSIAWFSLVALLAIAVLSGVGVWYSRARRAGGARMAVAPPSTLSPRRVGFVIAVLLALLFSKFFYMASFSSFYTFYLMHHFNVPTQAAQLDLFVFLGAVAVGTVAGGPIGDRIGRLPVIWVSILGILPFTLVLPYADLTWTVILSVPIGLILASAFSTIVVYAQDLMPGRTGTVSGLFFGFAFGLGGLGAALLGKLADATSIEHVYHVCSFLPAIGLLTALLPSTTRLAPMAAARA